VLFGLKMSPEHQWDKSTLNVMLGNCNLWHDGCVGQLSHVARAK